tara:strand:- start:1721 stop:1987 length:267 start_codon:yes stop_codon:yes gene_type:complete
MTPKGYPHISPPPRDSMAESYRATVEWSGDSNLGAELLAAASMHGYETEIHEVDKNVKLIISVNHSTLQGLRDSVDELLIKMSKIEEE